MAEGAAPPGSPGAVGGSGSSGSSASGSKRGGVQQQLAGVWRLVYSSGFAAKRSTGGRRPGVPISLLPAQFGQVYQGITPELTRLDNIVELRRDALPSLPFLPANQPVHLILLPFLKSLFELTRLISAFLQTFPALCVNSPPPDRTPNLV